MTGPKVLEDAIEGLYDVFHGYSLPKNTMPCSCCHAPGADDLLHAEPLRQLQWTHLADYAVEALMVWGDLNCYKHFLPRIFELVLTAGEWPQSPTPEMVFYILRYGHWRIWPKEEQKSIEQMLQAVWETVRSNPPINSGYIDVDQWLCCISQCEDDLDQYLEQWTRDERLSAAWALSSMILGGTIAYMDADTIHEAPVWAGEESRAKIEEWSKLPHRSAFWKNCDQQYTQLQVWVKSPESLEKLHRAEISCGNGDMAQEFAKAQQCIREAKTTKFEVVYKERRFQTAYWISPTFRLF